MTDPSTIFRVSHLIEPCHSCSRSVRVPAHLRESYPDAPLVCSNDCEARVPAAVLVLIGSAPGSPFERAL